MKLTIKRKAYITERIAALFIDYIIGALFANLIAILFGDFEKMFFLIFFVVLGYLIVKDIFFGRSLGKRIMKIGIKIDGIEDKRPEIWRMLLRNLFLVLGLIELIVFFVSKDKKRIGDNICKTDVYYLEKKVKDNVCLEVDTKKRRKRNVVILITVFLVSILFILTIIFGIVFSVVQTIKNGDPYKKSIIEIEKNEEINEMIGEIEGYGIIPTGNVSIRNGYGTSNLKIKVKGTKDSVWINTRFEKDKNKEWETYIFKNSKCKIYRLGEK